MPVIRLLFVLPRNMHFGPHGATSIDLCVRDLVNASRNRAPAVIAVGANGPYFPPVFRWSTLMRVGTQRPSKSGGGPGAFAAIEIRHRGGATAPADRRRHCVLH